MRRNILGMSLSYPINRIEQKPKQWIIDCPFCYWTFEADTMKEARAHGLAHFAWDHFSTGMNDATNEIETRARLRPRKQEITTRSAKQFSA